MVHFVSQTALGVWPATSSRAKSLIFGLVLLSAALLSFPQNSHAFAENISTDWRGGIPDNKILAYEITRKGKRLGFQTIRFEEADNGDVIANIHVQLDLKLGPIPLFRYRHENREVWRDGQLIELKSRTDNNGDDLTVDLRREGGAMVGRGPKFKNDMQGVTHSTSYFDPNFVRQTNLISSQDARLFETRTTEIGRETLNLKIGQVEATRFRTSGRLAVDIWYTDGGRWVRTEFSRGGYTLNIEAVNPTNIPSRKKWKRP